jgi:hypothetical protein
LTGSQPREPAVTCPHIFQGAPEEAEDGVTRDLDLGRPQLVEPDTIKIRVYSTSGGSLTSTFCKMPTTRKSCSEFLKPMITPGSEDIGASDGQKMRIKPLPETMSPAHLERPSPFQLYTGRDAPRFVARVLQDIRTSCQLARLAKIVLLCAQL